MFIATRAACVLAPACVLTVLAGLPAQAQMDMMLNADSTSNTTTTQGNSQAMTFQSAQPLSRTSIVTVPDAIAPSIAGGNPCVISASMAASGLGFGVSAGLGVQDPECEMRQQVALLVNMGQTEVAIARFCMDTNVRKAFMMAGKPCALPGAAPAVQPAVQQAPRPAVQPAVRQVSQPVVQQTRAVRQETPSQRVATVAAPVRETAAKPVTRPSKSEAQPVPASRSAAAVAKAHKATASERQFKWESQSGGPDTDNEGAQTVIMVDPAALTLLSDGEAVDTLRTERFKQRLTERERGE